MKTMCAMVMEKKCGTSKETKVIPDPTTKCGTKNECKTEYKTDYKQECKTVDEELCVDSTKTEYKEECKEEYEKE